MTLPSPLRLADAHAHFFAQGYRTSHGTPFPDGEELRVYGIYRKAHGISDTLAVGYGASPYGGNNAYLSRLAAEHEWLHPLAYVDALKTPSLATLRGLRGRRFRGVSLYLTNREAAEAFAGWPAGLWKVMNEQRLIVSINVPLALLSLIRRALERMEGCAVLVSHLGLPGVAAVGKLTVLERMARWEHVGVKASAFYACAAPADYMEYPHRGAQTVFARLLGAFGSGRLYWGSDFSPALEFVSFAQTLGVLRYLNLSRQEEADILGGNLRRVLAVK